MTTRNRLYYDDDIELVKEGATYVVVKRKPKMNKEADMQEVEKLAKLFKENGVQGYSF